MPINEELEQKLLDEAQALADRYAVDVHNNALWQRVCWLEQRGMISKEVRDKIGLILYH